MSVRALAVSGREQSTTGPGGHRLNVRRRPQVSERRSAPASRGHVEQRAADMVAPLRRLVGPLSGQIWAISDKLRCPRSGARVLLMPGDPSM
jgi:hypothetical protein